MAIDIDQLVSEIKDVTSGILAKDITALEGFSSRQLHGIATQAALVASGISSGQITDATRDFFLDQLIQLSHNFVNTLVGLVLATIQELWNAVVSVIWKAISKATGIQLPDFKMS